MFKQSIVNMEFTLYLLLQFLPSFVFLVILTFIFKDWIILDTRPKCAF